mmetsp:Transcript_121547/g.388896  ORF Transcript_121547/g.388896 Transcript_121547/m.388896 type:complete len:231 (-) Transcript_121547:2695-3387(-)
MLLPLPAIVVMSWLWLLTRVAGPKSLLHSRMVSPTQDRASRAPPNSTRRAVVQWMTPRHSNRAPGTSQHKLSLGYLARYQLWRVQARQLKQDRAFAHKGQRRRSDTCGKGYLRFAADSHGLWQRQRSRPCTNSALRPWWMAQRLRQRPPGARAARSVRSSAYRLCHARRPTPTTSKACRHCRRQCSCSQCEHSHAATGSRQGGSHCPCGRTTACAAQRLHAEDRPPRQSR